MKSFRHAVIAAALIWMVGAGAAAADEYQDTIDMFKRSPMVASYFESAYGYAVFPTVGKGGVIIGGAYGKGQVYQAGKITGIATLMKMSVGFQLGGQAIAQVIFFENQQAYDTFTSGSFEFGAAASAVIATFSAQGELGTTGNTAGASLSPTGTSQLSGGYNQGMMVFIHGLGGFMYEVSIGGQRFDFRPMETTK